MYNQKVCENTNATDLVNEIIPRKQMNTKGSTELATILNELNYPSELIGNPSYRKYMQSGHGILVNRGRKLKQSGRGIGKSNKRKTDETKQSKNSEKKSKGKSLKPRFKWCKF